jgi:TRAP-type mannitol/chloroaromatic compound transport system permease small subunit
MSYEANTDLESEADREIAVPNGAFGHLVDGLNAIGSIVIGAVMLLICADVLLRNLAKNPIPGVAELVASSIIVIVFLQLPATLRHNRMSRADLFIDPLLERRPAVGKRLRAVFSIFGIFACGIIAYASWPTLLRAFNGDEFLGVEGMFTFPVWPMRAVVVLGAAIAALQYLLLAIKDFNEAKK